LAGLRDLGAFAVDIGNTDAVYMGGFDDYVVAGVLSQPGPG
jgi:hypothetical protein